MPGFISDQRLYLNRDKSAVVDGDDPEAAFLLAGEGAEVSEEDAQKYGLSAPKAKADEAEEAPSPAKGKAVHQSDVEDKSVHAPKR